LERVDTALAAPNVVEESWEFISSTEGNLILLAIGIGWIAYLIFQPDWFPKYKPKPRIEDVDETASRAEKSANNTNQQLHALADYVGNIKADLDRLSESVNPILPPSFTETDEQILASLEVEYKEFSWQVTEVQQSVVFEFLLWNRSHAVIRPTRSVIGAPRVDTMPVPGAIWYLESWDPMAPLQPGSRARLHTRVIIHGALAETLALKGATGVNMDMSEMRFEVQAIDEKLRTKTIGQKAFSGQQRISEPNHSYFRQLQRFVRWKESLNDDR